MCGCVCVREWLVLGVDELGVDERGCRELVRLRHRLLVACPVRLLAAWGAVALADAARPRAPTKSCQQAY